MKLNIYVLLLIFLVILMYFQPSFLGNLCTNCFGKATLVLLIVFLAIQDIGLAILASVVLISSMHLVSREGFKEGNTGIPGRCQGIKTVGGGPHPIDHGSQDGCITHGTCHIGSDANAGFTTNPSFQPDKGIKQIECEAKGKCTDGTDGTEAECLDSNGTCNDSNDNEDTSLTNKTACIEAGTCSNDTYTNKTECTDNSEIWTPASNTWTPNNNTWEKYHWRPYTWDVSTQPDLACDAYQEHVQDYHGSTPTPEVSGFRNRKGGKEGFMVSSSELISFEDSKIRGKDSNIYPVSRPSVQNKGLFSGFNLF